MIFLLLAALLVFCRAAEFPIETDTKLESIKCNYSLDLYMIICAWVDEASLRKLMQVSHLLKLCVEDALVFHPIPPTTWSMHLIGNYFKEFTIKIVDEADKITSFIFSKVVPPSYVPFEDSPSALQELETRKYFILFKNSWLPTPEILLPEFMRSDIYMGKSCWTSQDQVYWLLNDTLEAGDVFVEEMNQYPEDRFMAEILAVVSQPVFKDLLTPFLMAHCIVPLYLRRDLCLWSKEMTLFLRRFSRATHCFDRYLAILYHLAKICDYENCRIIQKRVEWVCIDLDFKCEAISEPKTIDRIKSTEYEDLWKSHRDASANLAAIFELMAPFIPATPPNLVSVDTTILEDVEGYCGIMLPLDKEEEVSEPASEEDSQTNDY